jgi:hypothetical protein
MRMAAIRIQPFSLDGILANSYPFDHNWTGPLEVLMHNINMFERNGSVTFDGFENRKESRLPITRRRVGRHHHGAQSF